MRLPYDCFRCNGDSWNEWTGPQQDTLTRRAAIEVSIDEYRAIEQAVWEKLK